ncbi:30S ribosomal protein S14 [Blattabacterium clevelandi]|uniref:30S ribosomal protein S14 n=1 Tax=Blattabacterium clevelandi TaxID=164516 RepID=UPI000DE580E3|nr:30S ribosomal protein S14 [Blattabacterium clevelandi]
MAKESVKARQIKREKIVLKYAKKRESLKKSKSYELLQQLPRNASPVRLRNRCTISGRSRGYMRLFGISRIVFRNMVSQGLIPGVKKASW